MRDVAVVSFVAVGGRARRRAQRDRDARADVARGDRRSRASRRTTSGSCARAASTTCRAARSRSCRGSTRSASWPPIRESHVEMDAAWALYEAWVAIQTGEVDSALVYGFGKSSPGDLHEIMTLQIRPVLRAAAVAVDGRHGRAAGARVPRRERPRRGGPRRGRGPRAAQRQVESERGAHGRRDRRRRARRSRSRTTRCATPTSRRSPTAPPRSCSRPATSPARCASGRRGSAASSTASRRTASACATSRRRSRRSAAGVAAGVGERQRRRRRAARAVQPRGADPRRGARVERRHRDQPVGRPARVEPGDERGPDPHRRGRPPHLDGRRAPRRRARDRRSVPATEPGVRPGR